jgi:hypothetical protein
MSTLSIFITGITGAGIAQAAVAVPEIDPGMASSALALLTCGVLILSRRFTRK